MSLPHQLNFAVLFIPVRPVRPQKTKVPATMADELSVIPGPYGVEGRLTSSLLTFAYTYAKRVSKMVFKITVNDSPKILNGKKVLEINIFFYSARI